MKTILTCALLLLCHSFAFTKDIDWEKNFITSEFYFDKGEYKKGIDKLKTWIPIIQKSFGGNSLTLARVHFHYARYAAALCKYGDYRTYLENGMRILNSADKSNSNEYAITLRDLAEAYIFYTDFENADKSLKNALSLCEEQKVTVKKYVHKILATDIKIKTGKGYYHSAIHQSKNLEKEVLANIVKKESITNLRTGKSKFVKLTKEELRDRKKVYADLLNLRSECLIENGYYSSGDSLIKITVAWLKKNKGKKIFPYAYAHYLQALIPLYQNKLKEASVVLYTAEREANKAVKKQSELAIVIQEALITYLKEIGKHSQARSRNFQQDSRIRKYYGEKSFAYKRNNLLDIRRHIQIHEYDKAVRKINPIMADTNNIPKNHIWRANIYMMLHEIYIKTEMYDEAEKYMTKALAIKKEKFGELSPLYHMLNMQLANHYVLYLDKFKEAEAIFDKGFDVIKKEISPRHRQYLNLANMYAKMYELTDRFEKAYSMMSENSAIIKSSFGAQSVQYANTLVKMADLEIQAGKCVEADTKLNTALSIYKEKASPSLEDKTAYAEAYDVKAKLLLLTGDYTAAKKAIRESYRLTKKTADANELKMSESIEELALLNIYLGQYEETEQHLNQLISLREKKFGTKNRRIITPLLYLAEMKRITGKYLEAEKLIERAAAISKDVFGANSLKYSLCLEALQNIYFDLGDYEKAETFGKQAADLQIQLFGNNHVMLGTTLNQLALCMYYNNREPSKIQALFDQSLDITSRSIGKHSPRYAEILENMAIFYIGTKKPQSAEQCIKQANEIWIASLGNENIHTARILYIQGSMAYYNKNYKEALRLYTASADLYAKILDDKHPDYVQALGKIAQMHFILGDKKRAIESSEETIQKSLTYLDNVFPTLSERGKAKYWDKIKPNFEFYKTLTYVHHKEQPEMIGTLYNNVLRTKAILLNSTLKVKQQILKSRDTALVNNYQKWIYHKELLTSALSMTAAQRKENGIEIPKLEATIENLEKKLNSISTLFAATFDKSSPYDWKTLRKLLNKEDAAIEVISFNLFTETFSDSIYYMALIVTPDTKNHPDMTIMKNGNLMETKYIKYYRNCIKFDLEDNLSYNIYWKPIKDMLKYDKGTIYFSGDGVYNQINLESLYIPDKGYLIDHYNIVLVSSTRDLIKNMTKPSVKRKKNLNIALFGNPKYYASPSATNKISQLEGAEREVQVLTKLLREHNWTTEVYLNDKASEDAVKKLNNPSVLHIATHGFFMEDVPEDVEDEISEKSAGNPLLRSGLLFKNGGHIIENENIFGLNKEEGILTAYEAMNLTLDSTDLVVLSACETGLGEVKSGEGVYGLQRSFIVAGANSLVMTLFKVDDEITVELMETFYKKWIDSNNLRKSFVEAKREIKNKYKSPKYWGAFLLVGV